MYIIYICNVELLCCIRKRLTICTYVFEIENKMKSNHKPRNNTPMTVKHKFREKEKGDRSTYEATTKCRPTQSSHQKGENNQKSKSITLNIPRLIYCHLSIVIIAFAIITCIALSSQGKQKLENDLQTTTEALGWEAVDVFSSFDKDGDFYLSLEEAKPLLAHFIGYVPKVGIFALFCNIMSF